MASAGKRSVFDNPFLSTKIKSANVKPVESLIGYLVGPFCGLLANNLFGSYLVSYFENVLFASELAGPDAAGVRAFITIFPMISAILIVAGNLLAGQVIERTKTRAGKARPWILFSAVILAVASILMFIQPLPENTVFKMVWLVIAYNLFYAVAFPLYNTANSALVPVSTRNGKQRGLLASFVNMAVLGGAGAGSIVFPIVFGMLSGPFPSGVKDTPDSNGYLIVFVAVGVLTFIGCLLQYYFTRERVTEETMIHNLTSDEEKVEQLDELQAKEQKGPSMAKQGKALFTDKFFMVTIIFYLLYQVAGAIKNASMKSYTEMTAFVGFEIDPAAAMSVLGIVGAVPMAVAIVFVAPLCNKFGKRIVVSIGMAVGCVGGILAGIFYDNFIVAAIGIALKCLGSAPAGYMILAMIADCLDHMEAKNGFRCDGFGMSIYSAILIASVPIATGVVAGINSIGAYGSVVSYIWIESIAYGLAAIVVLFFGVEKYLPEDRQIILERQKAEAEAAGLEWIPPEERLRLEEEESDRMAEEARKEELKAMCEKKGLDYEEEEAKYQAALAEKARIKAEKEAAKQAKKKK